MSELNYTLVPDGPSDRALLPILTWLLKQQGIRFGINSEWADFRRLIVPPRGLEERILRAIELYPCELLFVHRDAERDSRERRVEEIMAALSRIGERDDLPPVVCAIPVRMQEAWLLIEEDAIRRASGNPRGRVALEMPQLARLERVPDPKTELYNLIREASELTGRRLKRLNVGQRAVRVAEYIEDYSPLRRLSAFTALEQDVAEVVRQNFLS